MLRIESVQWLNTTRGATIQAPAPTSAEMIMQTAFKLSMLTVAGLSLLAGIATARAQEPIRIGVLEPMTGPATKNGIENFTAMQIARDLINERGGINGRKAELLLADSPTPTAAVSETERLITKEGVKITLGSGVSQLAIPVSQTAERHGVFHWETAGAADIITKRGFKYTFQVGPAAYRYSQAAVDIVIEQLAGKLGKLPGDLRVALLWENRAFGKSVGDGVRAYAQQKGLKLIYDEGYDQTLTDMTAIVQKLKDVKPDVLLAISFPNDAILFQRKAKELDFNVGALVGVSAGYSNPDLRDSIGDMVNGIFVSDFAAKVNPKALLPETVKVAEEFFKRYDDKMKRPPAGHASSSFSATWALFTEVLPKAKTLEPDELREIALKLDLPPGALANGSGIKFTNHDWPSDPNDAGQNLRASIGVWQWQKSGNNQVFPINLATHEMIMVPLPPWSQR
jgi:branched-chain amino acid transport system substrate-binding protein